MSRLGLGTAPLAGLYDGVTDDDARATVDEAWSLGIRIFDTAPLYGSGLAESRLGAALEGRPRDDYTLSTKVGRVLVPGEPDPHFVGSPPLTPVFDFAPAAIRASLTASLERLRQDRVDIAFLHDPEEHLDEARRAIEAARELVPLVGVGTNVVATAQQLVERGEVDVVLLAGRYTLLDTSAGGELLPLCAERGVPVYAAGVFNSGVLAGGSTFDYAPASAEVLAQRDALAAACERHGIPLAAAAIQFPGRHPAVASVVVGARSASEIAEDVRLSEQVAIPDALWEEVTELRRS